MVLFIPELSVIGYFNIKNKTPITKINNPAFSNPITVESIKNSKALGSLGTALGIVKDNIEYHFDYEMHLAKKYTGHQFMVKARMHF